MASLHDILLNKWIVQHSRREVPPVFAVAVSDLGILSLCLREDCVVLRWHDRNHLLVRDRAADAALSVLLKQLLSG